MRGSHWSHRRRPASQRDADIPEEEEAGGSPSFGTDNVGGFLALCYLGYA